MSKNVMIMAGGTGGHIFPALAVANYLRDKGHQVTWLGTKQGLEARVVPTAGFEIDWLSVNGLRGKGMVSLFLAPFMLVKACWQALSAIRARKPNVVLGMGGFVAGPGGLMARLSGCPLVIHEQNRIPGTTNRLLSKIATRVLEAFPASFRKAVSAICTGNPLRKEIEQLTSLEKEEESADAKLNLLVIGGSLGAAVLNETVPAALKKLSNLSQIAVIHQSGEKTLDLAQSAYEGLDVEVEITPFIEDMAAVYSWAGLVICRAGAMTVSEVAAAGLAALFVPLPNAIDDHQTANARYLAEEGAAILMPQQKLNSEELSSKLEEFISNQNELVKMAGRARQLAEVEATANVAEICIKEAI
jgi:UDP-N-acetylglucosamine--N-acetylmuramyl-(pentapeptide) pyrophosphoryl-undecaprenol N-acetylglucosamine transferase